MSQIARNHRETWSQLSIFLRGDFFRRDQRVAKREKREVGSIKEVEREEPRVRKESPSSTWISGPAYCIFISFSVGKPRHTILVISTIYFYIIT